MRQRYDRRQTYMTDPMLAIVSMSLMGENRMKVTKRIETATTGDQRL